MTRNTYLKNFDIFNQILIFIQFKEHRILYFELVLLLPRAGFELESGAR